MPRHGAFEIAHMLAFANAPELARRFGFSDAFLDDPDAMLPLPLLHELLEALVEATGDPYFGAHFAATVDRTKFRRRVGALGLMMLSSPDVATAMSSVAYHQNRFNEGDRYAVIDHGDETHVVFEEWGPERVGRTQMAEKTVVQIGRILGLADPPIAPVSIHLAHAARPDHAELARTLGLPPEFGADQTRVVVRSSELERPIRGADPDLFHFFDRHLSREAEAHDSHAPPSFESTVASQALEAVRSALHRGEYSADGVAELLGLPLRTLQRRLADEGTHLKQIVDEVRRARAPALLETGMSVRDVSILLGYSGTAPFSRAFRRWYDRSPAAWRDDEREAG